MTSRDRARRLTTQSRRRPISPETRAHAEDALAELETVMDGLGGHDLAQVLEQIDQYVTDHRRRYPHQDT